MAHVYRFFGQRSFEGVWQLDEDEVTHALRVLRLADGEQVEVIDGSGNVGLGRLKIESKSKAMVVDVSESCIPKDPFCRSVIVGALKPGDVDEVIAPLVELGVDQLIIFRQADTAQFRLTESAMERWQRLVRSALKQSKRAWHVEVSCADDLQGALSKVQNLPVKLVLVPAAATDLLSEASQVRGGAGMAILIGGEKGLSTSELATAQASGFRPVRVGPWILRARTAAQAAAVFLGMLPH